MAFLIRKKSRSLCRNCGFILRRNINVDSHLLQYNSPPTGSDLPRFAGVASMMRLPVQATSTGLDACFVGVPLDGGTCNRSGTRFGPRQIRTESVLIRSYNMATGAAPYESLQVADVGDVNLNPYDLKVAMQNIRESFLKLMEWGCKTLAVGGEHTITYPILQAYKERYGPVGLIHIDAHDDTEDEQIPGVKIAHATPFRRAGEEGCLDFSRVIQIGLRGSCDVADGSDYAKKMGIRQVPVEDCWYKSMKPLMAEVREQMGDKPVYISFDIDSLDPAFAPGTGTPEVGGLTSIQALEIMRGCKGLNIVGGDVVEVSPPYDTTGTTALLAANLLFEMLCVLPGVKYKK